MVSYALGSIATLPSASRSRAFASIMRNVSARLAGATWNRANAAANAESSSSRRRSPSGVHSATITTSPRATGPRKKSESARSLSRALPMRPKRWRSVTRSTVRRPRTSSQSSTQRCSQSPMCDMPAMIVLPDNR